MLKFTVILAVLTIVACGQQQGLTAQQAPTATATPVPTSTPTAAPAQPITLSGTGSKVTDPVEVPKGFYRVTWKADGKSNFAVKVHGQQESLLVNVILPNPSSGEVAFNSGGGRFVFEIQADQASWSLTLTRVSA